MSNKYNDLPSLFTGIADAIREKKGTSDGIIADNFPDEIKAIEGTIDYVNGSIESIGDYTYSGMSNLKSVEMPNVQSVGNYAFQGCDNLSCVIMPNCNSIDSYSFYMCESLKSVTFGDALTVIGIQAFDRCTSLTNITIPVNVSNIEYLAFGYCPSLINITVDPNNQSYSSIDGNLYNKDKTTLIRYAIGKTDTEFNIPDGVVTIDNNAFSDCSALVNVFIPDSVININSYAFANCTNLSNIYIGNNVSKIEEDAILSCRKLKNIEVHNDNITYSSIDGNLYNYDKTLLLLYSIGKTDTEFIIPDGVESISNNAFKDAICLSRVIIPGSVKTIGEGAFANSGLTSIEIPEGVDRINQSVFWQCYNLSSISIPLSVSHIDVNAMFGCYNLVNINYNGTMEQWNEITFGDYWDENTATYTIHCTDGDIVKA